MAESKKEAASKPQKKKNSLLDDDLTDDFFGSWKMSGTTDDALDFNEKAAPKGKKNAFNFDKLDMDFSLDGDFGTKLSSFKVDMPDLDFSSPPKKPGKPKEKSEKESNLGKQEGKQDRFTFAFDFDELDNFDLDKSLTKSEKKSDKFPDAKGSDSPGKQEKTDGPRRKLVTSSDATEDGDNNKSPASEQAITSNEEISVRNFGKFDSINVDSPSGSADLGSLNDTREKSPEKQIIVSGQETDGYSQQSEKTISTESNAQETIQDSSIRSVSVDDSMQDVPELQAEVCSSATKVSTIPEGEQDIIVKPMAGLDSNNVKACNMESSPTNPIPNSTDNEFEKKSTNQSDTPTGNVNMDESMQGVTNMEDGSVASAAMTLLSTKPTKENKLIPKLLLAPSNSEPKSLKPPLMKIKGTDSTHSKPQVKGTDNTHSKPQVKGMGSMLPNPPNQLGGTESRLNSASVPKKAYPVGNKNIDTVRIHPSDARRQENNASDAQAGNQNLDSSKSQEHDRAVTKGVPAGPGRERDSRNHKVSASLQVQSANLIKQTTESKTLKGLGSRLHVSSFPAVRNLKSTSVERNKLSSLEAGKNTFDATCLKVSRPITPKNDLLHSKFQIEIKSLKHSEGNAVMQLSPVAKKDHGGILQKRGLPSPSLKRKMPEVSKAYPSKLVAGSPHENRDGSETFEKADNKRVRNTPLDSCNLSSKIWVPKDSYMKELEVPLLMENDGILEKAEAFAKELENICNMLKKKHEEAKEILVRAVVNNNDLLILNHPIYDEKIRMVQRLASRMASMELQTGSA